MTIFKRKSGLALFLSLSFEGFPYREGKAFPKREDNIPLKVPFSVFRELQRMQEWMSFRTSSFQDF